jgi:transposase
MSKLDARKLAHSTREAIRIRSVQQIETGTSPEEVARVLGIHRTNVYRWIARYREGGLEGLRFKGIPGKEPKLSGAQIKKIYDVVTQKNPQQLQFEFALWTRSMVRTFIRDEFGVHLSETSVGRLLRRMGLTPQRPLHRAYEQDPKRVEQWLKEQFPKIRRRAQRKGADIYFGDESGIRSDYHSGTTWAPKGRTPVVETTGSRYSLNLVSAISPRGHMRFMTVKGRMSAPRFIEFLRRLIENQTRRIFLIVDNHPAHRAKKVQEFVASTQGALELYFLPSYSPELNPAEFIWNQAKSHRLGREVIRGKDHLKKRVLSVLRSIQKTPELIRSFFQGPKVLYALG